MLKNKVFNGAFLWKPDDIPMFIYMYVRLVFLEYISKREDFEIMSVFQLGLFKYTYT